MNKKKKTVFKIQFVKEIKNRQNDVFNFKFAKVKLNHMPDLMNPSHLIKLAPKFKSSNNIFYYFLFFSLEKYFFLFQLNKQVFNFNNTKNIYIFFLAIHKNRFSKVKNKNDYQTCVPSNLPINLGIIYLAK